VNVLRADPDADTVYALGQLASVEVVAGSPDADRLTTEALILGQALDADPDLLGSLFTNRGNYLGTAGRLRESVAYLREAVRLHSEAGNIAYLGNTLGNLADALNVTDPAGGAEAARAATGHLRGTGDRGALAFAVANLVQALLMLGNWDSAENELAQATDSGGLADQESLASYQGLLAAMRGDTATVESLFAGLRDLRASEDPQDKAMISLVEAFTAAARHQPKDVLRHARAGLAHADALGISSDYLRWAWPLAARSAHELGDAAVVRQLLALLDVCPPGRLAPMQRAERDLARARLSARDGDPAAAASLAAAVRGLRELSTPYHLAHGLLDHAQHLTVHDPGAAEAAVSEARDIAARLRCQPLMDRAADLTSAKRPVQA
jgi:tetratricopeptide (TPR) repeat protein